MYVRVHLLVWIRVDIRYLVSIPYLLPDYVCMYQCFTIMHDDSNTNLIMYCMCLMADRFIVANDEFKLKEYNIDSKLCRKTTIAPRFGTPPATLLQVG